MVNQNKPKYLTVYESENGKLSLQSYVLDLVDKKTGEAKRVEMVRVNKKTNQFVEGYGYQDINRYLDMSAQAFKAMVEGITQAPAEAK